ncbi:MAG: endonuclease MutS2 [Bacillota bacterium]
MNNNTIKLLEYDKIKENLKQYAITDRGREAVDKLQPSIDIQIITKWLDETTETRAIVDKSSSVPLHSLSGIDNIVMKLGKTSILHPEELGSIARLLEDSCKIKRFMKNMESLAPQVSCYALSLFELDELIKEINNCIVGDQVDDRASSELYKIRKKIITAEDKIKCKLDSMVKTYGSYMQDAYVSMREGRYVIPVKKEHRRSIEGSVLDTSGSGSTVFIEPAAVKKLQDELSLLKIDEDKEVYRILSCLTNMVEANKKEISINIETIAHYDFLFAKAKLSRAMDGSAPQINCDSRITLINAKHPLIGKDAVPLNFKIGCEYRALLITGPNTGGKTVVLKTVGLLTMMAQSGLHIPADKGSELSVFRDILVDIGDGQSIEQSLSTFSSHLKNISSILECSDQYTLVIMDELGAGTDPGEGMGLATSVLEHVFAKGATILATTHYSELKDFADNTTGFQNGSMEFDIETLRPRYRLNIGIAGESNAFLIALRLGVDRKIIERAHQITYKQHKSYENYKHSIKDAQPEEFRKAAVEEIQQLHQNKQLQLKRIEETRERLERQKIEPSFRIGDCVYISTMNRTGIVCELENNKGEVGVMVMKNKFKVNKKRLSLYIDGKELYPEQYDMDIVLDSKDNRKKKKIMSKRHVEGMVIEISE